MSDRPLGVLEFITALTVVSKVHVETRFGPTASFDLKQLKARGLARHRSLAGRATIWQATAAGCHLVGVPDSRARRLGGQALHHALAIGHLVVGDKFRLLPREQAKELFKTAAPSISFVLSPADLPRTLVYRVLTPGPFTEPRAVARSIGKLEELYSKLGFNPRERGYLVTASSPLRKKALKAAFQHAKLYGGEFALSIRLVPSLLEVSHVRTNQASD